MSFAAHITAQQTLKTPPCKTCTILSTLDDVDQADFAAAVRAKVQVATIGRALCSRLAELERAERVCDASIRTHIRDGHGS